MKENGIKLEAEYTRIVLEVFNPGERSKEKLVEIEQVVQSVANLLFDGGIINWIMPPNDLDTGVCLGVADGVKQCDEEQSDIDKQILQAIEELDIRVSDFPHWYFVEYPQRVNDSRVYEALEASGHEVNR